MIRHVRKRHETTRKRKVKMKINWKVRVYNPTFWRSVIPAVLLMGQTICAVFGFKFDFGDLGNKLLVVVNTVFVVLTLLGIVADPTTVGTSDSARALDYENPAKNANQ